MMIRSLNKKSLKTIRITTLLFLSFYHVRSYAQTTGNDSFSRANFAFLVHNNSSLGFRNVGGSTLIFDVGNNLSSKISLGLRTLATGAENNSNRFYRLGTGVVLIYHIFPSFSVHVSPGVFHETATLGAKISSVDRREYGYTGTQLIAGWEKQLVMINNSMKLNWGTFLVYHSGKRDDSSDKNSELANAVPAETKGLAKGVEFSFEFSL